MFLFDVETLGKQTNSVVLSMACVYFNPDESPSPDYLKNNQTFFVKFNVEDQVKRLKRTMQKSTMEWWNKQCDIVKQKSFIPDSNRDVIIDDGIEMLREWSKTKPDNDKCWIFARGNLDQLIIDAVEEQLEKKPVFVHNRWRDVRTSIDFLYGTTNGYCDVDYPGFDPAINIYKHDPVDDCIYDIMMLIYGKKAQ